MTLGCILHNNGQVAFIVKHLFEPVQLNTMHVQTSKMHTEYSKLQERGSHNVQAADIRNKIIR